MLPTTLRSLSIAAAALLALASSSTAAVRVFHGLITVTDVTADSPIAAQMVVGDQFKLEFSFDDALRAVGGLSHYYSFSHASPNPMKILPLPSNTGTWPGRPRGTAGAADVIILADSNSLQYRMLHNFPDGSYSPDLQRTVLPLSANILGSDFSADHSIKELIGTAVPTVVGPGTFTFFGGSASFTLTGLVAGAEPDLVDTTAPKVVLTAPVIGSPLTIAGTVQENRWLTSFRVLLNGVPLTLDQAPVFTNTTVQNWSVGGLVPENGPNTIVIEAIDALLNKTVVSKTITFVDPALAARAGTYLTHIGPTGSETSTIDNTGLMTLTVTATGAFTGKVSLSGAVVSVSGLLKSDGTARFNPGLTDTFPLHDRTDYWMYLGSLGAAIFDNGGFSGEIYDDAVRTSVVAAFSGSRAYSSVNPPPAGLQGAYNIAWLSASDGSAAPRGSCIARATITATGAVNVVGTLADGTPLNVATKLCAPPSDFVDTSYGTFPIYASIYRKAGIFADHLRVHIEPGSSDILSFSGSYLWSRPPQRRARYYPAGFEVTSTLDTVGVKWTPAAVDFGQGDSDLFEGNAIISLEGGDLPDGGAGFRINIIPSGTDAGKVTLPTGYPIPGYSVSLTPSTGAFSGKNSYFTPPNYPAPGVKPITFRGLLIGKPDYTPGAFGWFLTEPTVDAYNASGHGGNVSIVP